ncbi:DUF1934 domain-containing protein [Streptococcus hongkongensis]|nr:50S ribosomal protein L19 [Streptococcus uberis]
MTILIKNTIRYDDQIEKIKEEYSSQFQEKGRYYYLSYQNTEEEKVVIKFNTEEMTISRFSQPQSIMKFKKNKQALIAIPTPVGIQQFITDTSTFELNERDQKVIVTYKLLQASSQLEFAQYQLEIEWK